MSDFKDRPWVDASLILAATDMLAALKVLADKAYTRTEPELSDVRAAFAAIAKAEGK